MFYNNEKYSLKFYYRLYEKGFEYYTYNQTGKLKKKLPHHIILAKN